MSTMVHLTLMKLTICINLWRKSNYKKNYFLQNISLTYNFWIIKLENSLHLLNLKIIKLKNSINTSQLWKRNIFKLSKIYSKDGRINEKRENQKDKGRDRTENAFNKIYVQNRNIGEINKENMIMSQRRSDGRKIKWLWQSISSKKT